MALGIDVSMYQSGINYGAARAGGWEFCIVKAGGSNNGRYVATGYAGHVSGARAAGMGIGHYWFNGTGDPATDAHFFVDNLYDYRAGDLLVLDIENEGGMPGWAPGQAAAFVDVVKARTGQAPMLYMSSSVTRQSDWQGLVDRGCKLWVASYGRNDGAPGTVPTGLGAWGDNWTIWQYGSVGGIPGYGGNIDKNTSSVPFDQIAGGSSPVIETTDNEDDDMKLFWTVEGTGYLSTANGVIGLASPQIYNLFYRLINADQKRTPFQSDIDGFIGGASLGYPMQFNEAEKDIMNAHITLIAKANLAGVQIDTGKLVSALNDALESGLTVDAKVSDAQLADAFNKAVPRISDALLKQAGQKLSA